MEIVGSGLGTGRRLLSVRGQALRPSEPAALHLENGHRRGACAPGGIPGSGLLAPPPASQLWCVPEGIKAVAS